MARKNRLSRRLARLAELAVAVRMLWEIPAVQRVTLAGVRRLAERWPLLGDLLGALMEEQGGATARAAGQPAASPAEPSPSKSGDADRWLEDLKSADWKTRCAAAKALAGNKDAPVTTALIGMLRDSSVEVAAAAAASLAQTGGPWATSALKEVLDNPEGFYSPLTRASAVRGLGQLLPEQELRILFEVMGDADAEVSLAAIAALSERPTGQLPDALFDVLERGDGFFAPVTRTAAARALARLDEVDEQRLAALQAGEADPEVRELLQPVPAAT